MRRTAILLFVCAVAWSGSACGDPIVVLGESPGTVRNVVGIGDSSGTRLDTIAVHARFLTLSAVAFDDDNNMLYVADRGATLLVFGITTPVLRLFSVTSAGRLKLELDGGGCTGGICVAEATSMIRGAGNSVVIADAQRNRVTTYNFDTHAQTNIAGAGTAANALEGGTATTSNLNSPAGVAIGPDGTLYVSERGAGRVLSIASNGNYHVVAGGGTQTVGTAGITATTALLGAPSGLAIAAGILYIADRGLHEVLALNLASGSITRIAGDGNIGFAGDEGIATDARLNSPRDVAISSDNANVYIADTGNNRVRSYNISSHIIRTYMGSGSIAYTGDHLAAGITSLRDPVELATSRLGFLFVVDQGHSVVRRATTAF